MEILLLDKTFQYRIENGWRIKNYGWYMTEEVFKAVKNKVQTTYDELDWGNTLHTLVVETEGKEIIVFPFILDKGKRRSMQRAVFAQDYKWYCEEENLKYFIDVCEKLDFDVLGINVYTGKNGEKSGIVEAKGLEDYLSKLGKRTRKTFRRELRDYYRLIDWEVMTEETLGEWIDLVRENIMRWSAQDETRLDKHKTYIDSYLQYAKELSKLDIAKVTLGRIEGKIVCGYLLVYREDRVFSVIASRLDIDLQLGYLMQIRKVEQMEEENIKILDLGTLDTFPHKKRWSTSELDTGAIGEGYL